jgi:hypothetical protein
MRRDHYRRLSGVGQSTPQAPEARLGPALAGEHQQPGGCRGPADADAGLVRAKNGSDMRGAAAACSRRGPSLSADDGGQCAMAETALLWA